MKPEVSAKTTSAHPSGRRLDAAPQGEGEQRAEPHGAAQPLEVALIACALLWPELDEHTYRITSQCLGDGQPEWDAACAALQREDVIQPTSVPGIFTVAESNPANLEAAVARLGGREEVERAVMAAWTSCNDVAVLEDLALTAEAKSAWHAIELLWVAMTEADLDLTQESLRVIRDVPLEARRKHPMLSWASGTTAALLATTSPERERALIDRILVDSALIHGDWTSHDDTDAAVLAGTYRMIGQRRMPGTRPTTGLEAAWTTKLEIDALIEQRTAEGRGPSRVSVPVFRAFSARLAMLRNDAPTAIQEARLAKLMTRYEPVRVLADGAEALARTLNFHADLPQPDPALTTQPHSHLAMFGMRLMGASMHALALGYDALNRLDRAGVESAIAVVEPAAADVAGVWSVRAALEGFHDAIWGDPAEGLDRLLGVLANRPPTANEGSEPLGQSMVGRARVLLLARTGALAAAKRAIEELPAPGRPGSAARAALWSGHPDEALRAAEAGLLQTDVTGVDRSRLTVLATAASLVQGEPGPAVRAKAAHVVEDLVTTGILWPLAALPPSVRHALLVEYEAAHGDDDPFLAAARERLATLNDAGSVGTAVRLTHRELELLPLLATDDTIPVIARNLQVSVHTVRTQVATLREKFGADSRAELVRRAALQGAISSEFGPSGGASSEKTG
jgi:DNA-binding CsgD family transcriptional regulator